MRADTCNLYQVLNRSPEDWSVRIRLIERAVNAGELAEAKRLVRESPDEGPLPAELQQRIFRLLTRP